MDGKSCFFIGHREADERLLPRLELTINRLILEEGVRYFYVGGYGGFDRIAATAVKKAKRQHLNITLMLMLPYHPAERHVETPNGFDGTYYPDGMETVPKRYAITRANRLLIDTCDWLICYVSHEASNAGKLLEYAQRRAGAGYLRIKNICESEAEDK